MAIFVDDSTKVVVQGITGRDGGFHSSEMLAYGTKVLAGVTPGRGGQKFQDTVPVYDTVKEAVDEHGVNTSVIFVPPFGAAGAIYEAADAGCKLIVCITEGVPTVDMVKVMPYLEERGVRLIGPNCPGLLAPGIAKLGILPTSIVKEGPVGLVSRSGTLTYEVVYQLTAAGLGQTTCLGIGGDPVIGTTFMDAIIAFNEDPQTEAFVMIGEIGGDAEEQAAAYIKENVNKPVVSFIAGQTAPPGKRMGHAGAIVSGGTGTAAEKKVALEAARQALRRSPGDTTLHALAATAAWRQFRQSAAPSAYAAVWEDVAFVWVDQKWDIRGITDESYCVMVPDCPPPPNRHSNLMWVPEVGYSVAQERRLLDHGISAAEAARLAGGLNSQQTMVVMRRDPKVLELIVAKDRTMYPARQEVNDQVEVRMLQGSGAMAFYQPAGIKIVTNVGPVP